MKVKVKNTIDSARALVKASVPTVVIDQILGKVVEVDEHNNVTLPWNGQPVSWNLPSECLQITNQ